MATNPAPALMDAVGADRFFRRGQRETIVVGGVIGALWLVGGALSVLSPDSNAGAAVLGGAVLATFYLGLPIGWWVIRGTRLRRAGRRSWRPGATPCSVPSPVDVTFEHDVEALPRPPDDLVGAMRARLEDWLPPGRRGDPLTDQMSVALVYHGAGREAGSPCGVFRLDGAMLGCVEYGRLLRPSGQLLAVSRQLLGGDRLWRTYRRRRFSLLATGDEVIAIGLRHTPSARRGERIAMIVLSEVVTTSQQWAAILDSCQALGLPVPVANE